MAEFICTNDDCEYTLHINKVKYTEVNGSLHHNAGICPECGSPLERVSEEMRISEIAISQGKFDSLSDSDKKSLLKKRSKAHFDKYLANEVKEKRHNAIQSVKDSFENKLNK